MRVYAVALAAFAKDENTIQVDLADAAGLDQDQQPPMPDIDTVSKIAHCGSRSSGHFSLIAVFRSEEIIRIWDTLRNPDMTRFRKVVEPLVRRLGWCEISELSGRTTSSRRTPAAGSWTFEHGLLPSPLNDQQFVD